MAKKTSLFEKADAGCGTAIFIPPAAEGESWLDAVEYPIIGHLGWLRVHGNEAFMRLRLAQGSEALHLTQAQGEALAQHLTRIFL